MFKINVIHVIPTLSRFILFFKCVLFTVCFGMPQILDVKHHGEAFYDHGRVGCINAGLMRSVCSAVGNRRMYEYAGHDFSIFSRNDSK